MSHWEDEIARREFERLCPDKVQPTAVVQYIEKPQVQTLTLPGINEALINDRLLRERAGRTLNARIRLLQRLQEVLAALDVCLYEYAKLGTFQDELNTVYVQLELFIESKKRGNCVKMEPI